MKTKAPFLSGLTVAGLILVSQASAQNVIQDDFNRPDSSSLGHPWVVLTGTMLEVRGGQAVGSVAHEIDDAVIVDGLDLSQQTIDVDWTPTGVVTGSGVDGRILARVRDANNYYAARVAQGVSTDHISIFKVVAGVRRQLVFTEPARVTSYPFHLQLTVSGNSLLFRVSRPGTADVILTATDGDLKSGSSGLVAFSFGSPPEQRSRYDNFVIRSVDLPNPDIDIHSAELVTPTKVEVTFSTAGNPGQFTVGVFRSADGITLNPADQIATQTVTPNPTNPQASETITLPTPWKPDASRPYLVVVADPTNAISEVSETNNQSIVKPGSIDLLIFYLQQTFPSADIRVTGRQRTVSEQASLMVEDGIKKLAQDHPNKFLDTYSNAPYAQEMVAYLYTPALVGGPRRWEVIWNNRKEDQEPTREAAILRFAEIIEQALRDGFFVSRHLTGDAIDISVPKTNQATIRRLLEDFGAHLDTSEHGNGPHWHITYLL